MLELGNNVNFRDAQGLTPLIVDCYHNQIEVAETLLEVFADIDANNFVVNTALMSASFRGH